MSPQATPTIALSKLLTSNTAGTLADSLPIAEAELDRALDARDFEPSVVAKRVAKLVNRGEYSRADRLVAKKASSDINDAAFDLRMMEADASFALGIAFGLKLAGGAK